MVSGILQAQEQSNRLVKLFLDTCRVSIHKVSTQIAWKTVAQSLFTCQITTHRDPLIFSQLLENVEKTFVLLVSSLNTTGLWKPKPLMWLGFD